ncbi:hypothetical protein B6K86_04985 [Lachnospiraceae bacterium]|nr:hypothetical protein B6K86_04985 [Lachnospiraceae bacterium]
MKNKIICIGRQYGSGGREIGRLVAEKLGIPYYDRDLIDEALRGTDLPMEQMKKADEHALDPLPYERFYRGENKRFYGMNASEIMFSLQKDLIIKKAESESCVIIGRCADQILEDAGVGEVLSLFISAPIEDRMQRVMEREKIGAREASALIRKIDKRRRKYYGYYTDKDWGKSSDYTLCINSSEWKRDALVQFICDVYNKLDEYRK